MVLTDEQMDDLAARVAQKMARLEEEQIAQIVDAVFNRLYLELGKRTAKGFIWFVVASALFGTLYFTHLGKPPFKLGE